MVKCGDCGFLALRNEAAGQLLEADLPYRRAAMPSPSGIAQAIPLCFERCRDFEVDASARIDRFIQSGRFFVFPQDNMRELLFEDIECESFIRWRMGNSPKEHREMLDRQRLLEWQTGRDNTDRQWRDDQRDADRKWRWLELVVLGGVSVIVAGTFTLLGAFIQRGGNDGVNVSVPAVTVVVVQATTVPAIILTPMPTPISTPDTAGSPAE